MNVQNNDKVKNSLQQALGNSTAPLRDELWDKLAMELDNKPKRRKAIWFLSVLAVAMVAIGLAIYLPTRWYKNGKLVTIVQSAAKRTENNATKVVDNSKPFAETMNEEQLKNEDWSANRSKTSRYKQLQIGATNDKEEYNINAAAPEWIRSKKETGNAALVQASNASVPHYSLDVAAVKTTKEENNTSAQTDEREFENNAHTETQIALIPETAKPEKTGANNEDKVPADVDAKKAKNIKVAVDKGPNNSLRIAVNYALGNANMRVLDFARPETVHREFGTLVESNTFWKQQIGLGVLMPVPKTKQWALGLGLNRATFTGKDKQTYTLNYGTVRDTTFAIINYFYDTARYSISQQNVLRMSQWELPITAMYFIPNKSNMRIALLAGLNLSKTQSSGGDFINVNEFETQNFEQVLQNKWDAQWKVGAEFAYLIWNQLWLGANAQWQQTNLQSNIGYTSMRSRLQGWQFGVSLNYDLISKK